jgi:hypothetical protein
MGDEGAPIGESIQVLVGALIAAGASLVTAWLTELLTRKRETRGRLFDVRRELYAEALRFVSVAQHTITENIAEDAGFAPFDASRIIAQLEVLASPGVHSTIVLLSYRIPEVVELRDTIAAQAENDEQALEALRGSAEMARSLRALQDLQATLVSHMRRDLEAKALSVYPGTFGGESPPGEVAEST